MLWAIGNRPIGSGTSGGGGIWGGGGTSGFSGTTGFSGTFVGGSTTGGDGTSGGGGILRRLSFSGYAIVVPFCTGIYRAAGDKIPSSLRLATFSQIKM